MARLRRSKLAAGFLLLFQCLSERCQLAGGETPRQSRGKRGRYLPGGAPPVLRGARGSAAGRGRAGAGAGPAPQPPRGGLCRPLRGPRTRRGQTPFGAGSPSSRERPGVPASHPSLPRLPRKELSITSFLILMRIRDFPPLMNLPRDHWEPVMFPSPAPPRGPRRLLPSLVRDVRGSPREPGREGRSPRSPGERRPDSLPRPPSRAGGPQLSRQRAGEGWQSFPADPAWES